jgi:hypothetical protein
MAELVHHRTLDVQDRNGSAYDRVFVYAEPQPAGTWQGWLEFVSRDGEIVVQTDRETTQSTLEGVAYWATGLQPTYLEGALDRALSRAAQPRSEEAPASPTVGGGAVRMRLVTVDPSVPFQLMATRTLVPGLRRHIHNGGVILYRGRTNPTAKGEPGIYEFAVQFGSENAAAILANRLWNDLHGLGATLEIEGEAVPVQNGAIKDALLAAQATT